MLHHFGKSNLYETTKQSKIMSEHFLQKKKYLNLLRNLFIKKTFINNHLLGPIKLKIQIDK